MSKRIPKAWVIDSDLGTVWPYALFSGRELKEHHKVYYTYAEVLAECIRLAKQRKKFLNENIKTLQEIYKTEKRGE